MLESVASTTTQTEAQVPEKITITSNQRAKAARAIIKSYQILGDSERLPDVIRTLAVVLAKDELPLARARAATALGSIREAEVLALLLPALDDSAAKVRLSAVQAIAQSCDKTNANPVFVPDKRPAPKKLLLANKFPYRVGHWGEFAMIPEEGVVERLARLLGEDTAALVRQAVAKAFEKLKNKTEPVTTSLLMAGEHDGDNSVQIAAMHTLAELEVVQVYPIALRLVEDSSEVIKLRGEAVYALGQTSLPAALEQVCQILLNLDRLIPPLTASGKHGTSEEIEDVDIVQAEFCEQALNGLYHFEKEAVMPLTTLLANPSLSRQATITIARRLGFFHSLAGPV